jgi:hypothetical protein
LHFLRHRAEQDNDLGWLDSELLMKQLGLEETHMNIQIFRACKQVAATLTSSTGHSRLIERLRGAMQANIKNIEFIKKPLDKVSGCIN